MLARIGRVVVQGRERDALDAEDRFQTGRLRLWSGLIWTGYLEGTGRGL